MAPVETDLEKALGRAGDLEVLDDSEDVESTLFKANVAPPKAAAPRGAKDNSLARFLTESTFRQGCIDCFGLDFFA